MSGGRENYIVTARFIGNQSKCCHYSTAITLCSIYYIMVLQRFLIPRESFSENLACDKLLTSPTDFLLHTPSQAEDNLGGSQSKLMDESTRTLLLPS